MNFSLHLVADFDEVWLPAAFDAPSMRRLEAFLGCFPGVVLTLLSAQPLPIVLERLDRYTDVLPDHWVTQNGKALHHRSLHGSWEEDLDFPHWLPWPRESTGGGEWASRESGGIPTPLVGEERATAIEFLTSQWEESLPLAVAATPWRDWGLLQSAHVPITVGPTFQEEPPSRGFQLAPGKALAAGILGALLTHLEERGSLGSQEARLLHEGPALAMRGKSFPIPQEILPPQVL
ncbi:MAG: hypothetical protein Q8O00_06785 [Holophaga sp.]|nr:hypothetical protein [Holophaga sp.]